MKLHSMHIAVCSPDDASQRKRMNENPQLNAVVNVQQMSAYTAASFLSTHDPGASRYSQELSAQARGRGRTSRHATQRVQLANIRLCVHLA